MKLVSLLLLISLLSAPLVNADEDSANCKVISKAKATSVAQKAIDGKALSATLVKSKGPPVYRVKVVLENGRVKTILVDGCTGRVIKLNN